MFSNGFELSVEVNGRNIPEFGHRGRTFVEGRKNHRYSLKFRNSRAERILVVPTVDGLSVLDGNPYHDGSTGYVVQGYSSLTIHGWRTSLSEVRAFEFSDKSGSYAGKTVGHANCGIIGARVYTELRPQVKEVHIHHYPTGQGFTPSYGHFLGTLICSSNTGPTMDYSSGPKDPPGVTGDPGGSINTMAATTEMTRSYVATNNSPDFNLGTTYGQAIQDNVTNTTFERGLCVAAFEIYYSDREGLLKDGIQLDKAPEVASFPQAFGGFCKLPS